MRFKVNPHFGFDFSFARFGFEQILNDLPVSAKSRSLFPKLETAHRRTFSILWVFPFACSCHMRAREGNQHGLNEVLGRVLNFMSLFFRAAFGYNDEFQSVRYQFLLAIMNFYPHAWPREFRVQVRRVLVRVPKRFAFRPHGRAMACAPGCEANLARSELRLPEIKTSILPRSGSLRTSTE